MGSIFDHEKYTLNSQYLFICMKAQLVYIFMEQVFLVTQPIESDVCP